MAPGTALKTRIHLDLDSVRVLKTDLDKVIFGLFKYATGKGFKPPFEFTASTSSKDVSYLGVLKNNNVRLVDDPGEPDITFNNWNPSAITQLKMITNMPVFSNRTRACVYIDWDNIQVSLEYVKFLLSGMVKFVHGVKVHETYEIYVFLHNKTPAPVIQELKKYGASTITIIKDKSGCGDEEIFGFIRRNTVPGDSICVASGDRDFSSLMVEYVRNSYNVFLVYNQQALYTFKHNKHWIESIDVKSIKGVDSRRSTKPPRDAIKHTKPCKFYNMDTCKAVSCNFLHICGICGRPHRMQDFHPGATVMKSVVCKKFNAGACKFNGQTCDYLHVCQKCKKPHAYIFCEEIGLSCPICKINIANMREYVAHLMENAHIKRIDALKKIFYKDDADAASGKTAKHVLII
jgi:hypothetical protein